MVNLIMPNLIIANSIYDEFNYDESARSLVPYVLVCSGSVVVIPYDSESGNPGSNPEWGLIYYEASITAQGLPEQWSSDSDWVWIE